MVKRLTTIKRIAFTGPESTGKSTLSKQVANSFNGTWILEYARPFLEQRGGVYDQKDLDQIAQKQAALINENTDPFLVADTELLVLKIWSEFKYGQVSPMIEELWRAQNIDHYFLCDIDLPWENDPLREHPEPEARKSLFEMYLKALEERQVNYTVLSGAEKERMDQVKKILTPAFFSTK